MNYYATNPETKLIEFIGDFKSFDEANTICDWNLSHSKLVLAGEDSLDIFLSNLISIKQVTSKPKRSKEDDEFFTFIGNALSSNKKD